MNNLLPYIGLVDAKIRASDKDLSVHKPPPLILVHQYQIQRQMFMTLIAVIFLNVVGNVLKIGVHFWTLKKDLNYLTLMMTTTVMTTTITMIMVLMTLG